MLLRGFSAPIRKALLVLAGILICLYAVRVLWYVQTFADIGLRCGFTTEVNEVYPEFAPPVPERLFAAAPPSRGDRIVQVGTRPVNNWPKLLRSLIELTAQDPVMVTNLAEAERRGLTYAGLGTERYVFVRLSRTGPEGIPLEYGCWRRLGRLPAAELVPSILWFFLKIGLFVVGALVFWKRPTDAAASQFFLLCIVTVGAYIGGYNWAHIATDPLLLVVFMICGVMLPVVSLHFYLVFPRPKGFLLKRPGWTLATIYGVPGVFLAALIVSYFWVRGLVRGGAPDDWIAQAWWVLRAETAVYLFVAACLYLASVLCLVHSYRTALDVTERNQVKWILFGALAALVPLGYTLYLIFWDQDAFGAGGAWYMFAASVCFTLAFAVSITRYRLLQLDQIVSSGAIYVLISILAALVYYAVVFAGMLGANLVGTQVIARTSLMQTLWVSTTALILMVLLNVVQGRFKKALDRRFYRDKHQLDRTLKRMGQAIEQLVDPPTLARRLLQASADLLGASRGAVYLQEGEPPLYRLVGSLGASPPPLVELSSGCPLIERLRARKAVTLRLGEIGDQAQRQLKLLGGEVAYALAHEDQLLAFLVLGPKDVGLYGTDDLNLLAAFAQLTALALESAQGHRKIEVLNGDLRAKIDKISEQQRRILALQSQLTKGAVPRGAEPPPANGHAANGKPAAEVRPASADPFAGLIGPSLALRQVIDMARKVAPTPSAVLIQGESGTGKELLARALHDASPRAGRAFVTVHCAALSAGLLESELFGHVKGAFTSAHKDKIGRFELASGGTLFLDEIGDINLEVQTKLLRVLQEKTFERVGSSEPLTVDVRILAATHQDLEQLIRQSKFRQDLYYRLNVINLTIPALRERREDIFELALHFLRVYAQRYNKEVAQLDEDAVALLKTYAWPGNIRELENVIERAVVVAETPIVLPTDLPGELTRGLEGAGAEASGPAEHQANGRVISGGLRAEREEFGRRERERLVRALASAQGNKAEAARALGLARSTLVSRLKKHGLT